VIWNFFDTGFNTGKYNMDFDLQLVERLHDDEVYFRLYRWKPYCISLGANQPFESVDAKKANQEDMEVVKRPTGGRAILHAEELTYSIIHPVNNFATPKQLYHEINLALKKGLENYNSVFQKIELEHNQPHFPSFYKESKSTLCFAVSAKSEINFEGKKLVGSAQRKIGNTILQHGSILCGNFHKRIIDYLRLPSSEKEMIKNEIENTTIELKSILNEEIDYEKLIESLKTGFEEHFHILFNKEKLEAVNS
jgi:lipoate-protein ligase A